MHRRIRTLALLLSTAALAACAPRVAYPGLQHRTAFESEQLHVTLPSDRVQRAIRSLRGIASSGDGGANVNAYLLYPAARRFPASAYALAIADARTKASVVAREAGETLGPIVAVDDLTIRGAGDRRGGLNLVRGGGVDVSVRFGGRFPMTIVGSATVPPLDSDWRQEDGIAIAISVFGGPDAAHVGARFAELERAVLGVCRRWGAGPGDVAVVQTNRSL